MIGANIFAFSQKSERTRRDSAIVMAGAASVNASPDTNSNQLFELHEGTKVKSEIGMAIGLKFRFPTAA